jgi:hypothetical protein
LDEGGDDERGRLVEVYDDPQPAADEDMLQVKSLAARKGIPFTKIRAAYALQDRVDVIEQLRSTAP